MGDPDTRDGLIAMLLSDGVYKRIPMFWMLGGILFLVLGLAAGPEVDHFAAYLVLGFACITRSIWIYQARWKYHKRNKINIAKTVCIVSPRHGDPDRPGQERKVTRR